MGTVRSALVRPSIRSAPKAQILISPQTCNPRGRSAPTTIVPLSSSTPCLSSSFLPFFLTSLPSGDPDGEEIPSDVVLYVYLYRRRGRETKRVKERERERGRLGAYYVYSIGPDILWCHPRQTVLFATGQEGYSLTFCQLDRDNGKQDDKRIWRPRGDACGKTSAAPLDADWDYVFVLEGFGNRPCGDFYLSIDSRKKSDKNSPRRRTTEDT